MVSIRRSSIYHRSLSNGAGHGTRSRLPVLWTRTKKVCIEHDMGVYGIVIGDHVSVVLLGILAGIQPVCDEWFHWGFEEVWAHEYFGCAESW